MSLRVEISRVASLRREEKRKETNERVFSLLFSRGIVPRFKRITFSFETLLFPPLSSGARVLSIEMDLIGRGTRDFYNSPGRGLWQVGKEGRAN